MPISVIHHSLSCIQTFGQDDPVLPDDSFSNAGKSSCTCSVNHFEKNSGPSSSAQDDEHSASPSVPNGLYIKLVPHPHSGIHAGAQYITLEAEPIASAAVPSVPPRQQYCNSKPWAPFLTLSDFQYTKTAVHSVMSKDAINEQLAGIHGPWSTQGSTLTIKNYKDMRRCLDAARKFTTEVGTSFLNYHVRGVIEGSDL